MTAPAFGQRKRFAQGRVAGVDGGLFNTSDFDGRSKNSAALSGEAFDGALTDVGHQPVQKPLGARVSVMRQRPCLDPSRKHRRAFGTHPHLRIGALRDALNAHTGFQRKARHQKLHETAVFKVLRAPPASTRPLGRQGVGP